MTDTISAYLTYLENPDSLTDHEEVARLESEVASTTDPLGKLKAIAALDKARHTDPSGLRQAFVGEAYAWAMANGVPAGAFRQMGVSEADLRDAGFDVGGKGKAKTKGKARAINGTRARAVPTAEIESWILGSRGEAFTINEAVAGTGSSPMTVKKTLGEMIDSGKVQALGQAQNWTGRGRVPNVYSLAS